MTQEINYPTHETLLWLNNEKGSYDAFVNYTHDLLENETRKYEIAETLEKFFREMCRIEEVYNNIPLGPLQSLFGFVVEQIDFYVIAEHYIDIVNDNQRLNNEPEFNI